MNASEDVEIIDHSTIDWTGVIAAWYRIEQTLRYAYDSPIHKLRHQLMIAPRLRHLGQERLDHRIRSSMDVRLTFTTDTFGNELAALSMRQVERDNTFGLASTICGPRMPRRMTNGSPIRARRWNVQAAV